MSRKITVKGKGYASVKPDLIVFSLTVNSKDFDYETAMKKATDASHILADALEKVQFSKDDLKTTDFSVSTEYNSVKDKKGNYTSVFDGYRVRQKYRLEFPLDFKQMATALTAISRLTIDPELSIRFTVKDSASVSEILLRSATQNAKATAEILAEASGVSLGELIDIDYSWIEIDFYSDTDFGMRESAMMSQEMQPHIVPEDVTVTDTVTFIWEIK